METPHGHNWVSTGQINGRKAPRVPPKPARIRAINQLQNVGESRQMLYTERFLIPEQTSGVHGHDPVPITTEQSPPIVEKEFEASSSASETAEDDFTLITNWFREGYRPSAYQYGYLSPDLFDMGGDVELFPRLIVCKLSITFNGKALSFTVPSQLYVSKPALPFPRFKWYQEESYDRIKAHCDKKMEAVRKQLEQPDEHGLYKFYLRHGSCEVQGTNEKSRHVPDTSIFDLESLHQVAVQQICKFISTFPYRIFQLVIFCDYGSIQQQPSRGSYRDLMFRQYGDKLNLSTETVRNQQYIPMGDLNELTTQEISECLIDEDDECGDQSQKDKLKWEVAYRVAQTLLAACIWACIPLKQFKHFLIDHQYSDSNMKWSEVGPDSKRICQDPKLCYLYNKKLLESMCKFFVHQVEEDRWFHERGEHEVVPISFKSNTILGAGTFSEVWEVSVDVAHRVGPIFSSDLPRTYALKMFTRTSKRHEQRLNAFRKQIRMFLYLASYPHPHILTHITSWEQRGTFYILYEKAQSNLYGYMQSEKGGKLTKEHILWFLRQLHGFADAVRKERLRGQGGRREYKDGSLENQLGRIPKVPENHKKTGLDGCHHGIKPENILVFPHPDYLPILKLSDFSAAKFSMVGEDESGRSASGIHGTVTYHGPENEMGMKTTRPFDMWALGCAFLEFLLWFLDLQKPFDGKDFPKLRGEAMGPNIQLGYFWQTRTMQEMKQRQKLPESYRSRHKNGGANDDAGRNVSDTLQVPGTVDTLKLNEAVTKVLGYLKYDWCREMDAFVKVIEQISGLLVIDPRKRLSSADLAYRLDAILAQAEVDLSRDDSGGENFYSKTFQRNWDVYQATKEGKGNSNFLFYRTRIELSLPAQISVPQEHSADGTTVGSARRRKSIDDIFRSNELRNDYSAPLKNGNMDTDNQLSDPMTLSRKRSTLQLDSGDNNSARKPHPSSPYGRGHSESLPDISGPSVWESWRDDDSEISSCSTDQHVTTSAYRFPEGLLNQKTHGSPGSLFDKNLQNLKHELDPKNVMPEQWGKVINLAVDYFEHMSSNTLNVSRQDVDNCEELRELLQTLGVQFDSRTTRDELLVRLVKRRTQE